MSGRLGAAVTGEHALLVRPRRVGEALVPEAAQVLGGPPHAAWVVRHNARAAARSTVYSSCAVSAFTRPGRANPRDTGRGRPRRGGRPRRSSSSSAVRRRRTGLSPPRHARSRWRAWQPLVSPVPGRVEHGANRCPRGSRQRHPGPQGVWSTAVPMCSTTSPRSVVRPPGVQCWKARKGTVRVGEADSPAAEDVRPVPDRSVRYSQRVQRSTAVTVPTLYAPARPHEHPHRQLPVAEATRERLMELVTKEEVR